MLLHLLDALDLAVVLLEHNGAVAFVNACATHYLAADFASTNQFPESLRKIADGSEQSRFCRARRVVAPSGHSFYVRSKRMPETGATMLLFDRERVRKDDPIESIRRRHDLTARQAELIGLICSGASNAEIAAELELTVGTVKGYVSEIYEICGVQRRPQLIALVHSNSE